MYKIVILLTGSFINVAVDNKTVEGEALLRDRDASPGFDPEALYVNMNRYII